MEQAGIGLSPELLNGVFPFHIAVNRSLEIIQTGDAIRRVFPDLLARNFLEFFHLAGSSEATDFAALQRRAGQSVILERSSINLRFKGQLVYLPERDTLCFLGVPWVKNISELEENGLSLTDFSPNDATGDLLMLVQAQQATVKELRHLTPELTRQRSELRAKNVILGVQNAVTRLLATAQQLPDIAMQLLETLSTILKNETGALWIVDPSDEYLVCNAFWSTAGKHYPNFATATQQASSARGHGIIGQVWELGVPLFLSGLTQNADFLRREEAAQDNLNVGLFYPLRQGSKTIGVLEFCGAHLPEMDAELRDCLETLCGLLGQYIARTKSDDATRLSEARKAAILESALDCIITMDHQGYIQEFNPAAERTFGYPASEMIGKLLVDMIIPLAYREAHTTGLQRYLETGEGLVLGKRIEITALRRSGETFPVELAITPIKQQDYPMFSAYLRDISQEKRIEREREETVEKLQEANRFIQRVTDLMPSTIYVFDLESRRNIYFNHPITDALGYSLEEAEAIENNVLFALLHPDDREIMQRHLDLIQDCADGAILEVTYRMRHKNGSYRWQRSHDSIFLRNEEGKPSQILGYAEDVTERRKSEEELRRSEARLSTLISRFQAAVLVEDESRRVVLTNQQFCDMFGIPAPPVALIGSDCAAAADQTASLFMDPRGFLEQIQSLLRESQPVAGEELQMADGRFLERDFVPVRIGHEYRGYLWLYRNVTERKKAERHLRDLATELQRSNRELDHFASVASHDLQEPLRKIRMFGDRLREESKGSLNKECHEYLDRMLSSTGRMKTLIDDLLRFARVTTRGKAFININLDKIVSEVVEDLEARRRETSGIITIDPLPRLEADPTQMRQVFQNLIANALKFHRSDVPPQIHISAEWPLQKDDETLFCRIKVQDNGIGFETEYNEVIFDVFERLHETGNYEGTGIGLAICRKIVERHQGIIHGEGTPGSGAVFIVELPLYQISRPSSPGNDHKS